MGVVATLAARPVLAGLVATICACDDSAANVECRGLGYPYYCQAPLGLALRTTTHLSPTDDEVLSYYRKLRPVYEQEPVLRLVTADNHYSYFFNSLEIATSDAMLIADLRALDPEGPASGPLLADAPLSLEIVELGPDPSFPDLVVFELTVDFSDSLSWRVLRDRVALIEDTHLLGEELPSQGMDIIHYTDGQVDVFDMSLGWGDCNLGCINIHRWRVRNDMGVLTIEDLGGANVESEMAADALALPSPPEI